MTPAVVQLMQRLADGETITCPDDSQSWGGIYLRTGRGGSLEFRNINSHFPLEWHDAGIFYVSSLPGLANRALPPEPEQPKRQVRSIDLSE